MNYKHDGKAVKGDHLIQSETKKAVNLLAPTQSTNPLTTKAEPFLPKEGLPPVQENKDAFQKEQKPENKTDNSFTHSVYAGEETVEALLGSFTKLIEMNAE